MTVWKYKEVRHSREDGVVVHGCTVNESKDGEVVHGCTVNGAKDANTVRQGPLAAAHYSTGCWNKSSMTVIYLLAWRDMGKKACKEKR